MAQPLAAPAPSAAGSGAALAQTKPTTLTTVEIVRFFVPLAATTMFIAVIFNVMNSAMAHTAQAAAALAAFSVGQSMADLISVPASSGQQWLIARGRDKRSFRYGLGVMYQIIVGVTVVLALAGWTSLGRWLYEGLFNAPPHLSGAIAQAIKVCLPLPVIFTVRGAAQAVLMLRRKTQYMTLAVIVRLGYVFVAASVFPRVLPLHGGAIGALLWVTGMGVEGTVAFLAARRFYRELPETTPPAEAGAPALRPRIWPFLLPLIATSVLWSLGKPILNIGMARSTDPETSIAVYQVAWNAAWLLISYVQGGFRQVVVVFWNDEASLRALQRFATRLALGVSALLFALTASGAATWFLREVVGAAEELIGPSRGVLFVMSVLPLALVATEVSVGRLLRNGTTAAIGVAKGANLAAMAVVSLALAAVAPEMGPMIGALAMLAGVGGELVVSYWATRRLTSCPSAGDV